MARFITEFDHVLEETPFTDIPEAAASELMSETLLLSVISYAISCHVRQREGEVPPVLN